MLSKAAISRITTLALESLAAGAPHSTVLVKAQRRLLWRSRTGGVNGIMGYIYEDSGPDIRFRLGSLPDWTWRETPRAHQALQSLNALRFFAVPDDRGPSGVEFTLRLKDVEIMGPWIWALIQAHETGDSSNVPPAPLALSNVGEWELTGLLPCRYFWVHAALMEHKERLGETMGAFAIQQAERSEGGRHEESY